MRGKRGERVGGGGVLTKYSVNIRLGWKASVCRITLEIAYLRLILVPVIATKFSTYPAIENNDLLVIFKMIFQVSALPLDEFYTLQNLNTRGSHRKVYFS